jgi:hypothetical protein
VCHFKSSSPPSSASCYNERSTSLASEFMRREQTHVHEYMICVCSCDLIRMRVYVRQLGEVVEGVGGLYDRVLDIFGRDKIWVTDNLEIHESMHVPTMRCSSSAAMWTGAAAAAGRLAATLPASPLTSEQTAAAWPGSSPLTCRWSCPGQGQRKALAVHQQHPSGGAL